MKGKNIEEQSYSVSHTTGYSSQSSSSVAEGVTQTEGWSETVSVTNNLKERAAFPSPGWYLIGIGQDDTVRGDRLGDQPGFGRSYEHLDFEELEQFARHILQTVEAMKQSGRYGISKGISSSRSVSRQFQTEGSSDL